MINEVNGIDESGTWHDAIAGFTEVSASSTEATRPNIFRVAGFPRRETVSSNVLAYFFDPAEGHGLKDMMLKALLRTIHKEDMDVSDVSVSTEVSTGKNNRIDILLDLPELSIAIEKWTPVSITIWLTIIVGRGKIPLMIRLLSSSFTHSNSALPLKIIHLREVL